VEEDIQSIVTDIGEKVQKRLAGFNEFVEVIESGVDLASKLLERFGASQDYRTAGRR